VADEALKALHDKANAMQSLLVTEGWQVISAEIKREIDSAYKELRSSVGDYSEKAKGKLDAFETVLALPERIISRRDISEENNG